MIVNGDTIDVESWKKIENRTFAGCFDRAVESLIGEGCNQMQAIKEVCSWVREKDPEIASCIEETYRANQTK